MQKTHYATPRSEWRTVTSDADERRAPARAQRAKERTAYQLDVLKNVFGTQTAQETIAAVIDAHFEQVLTERSKPMPASRAA